MDKMKKGLQGDLFMDQEKDGLSLIDIWRIIKKNILIIIISTIIATAAAIVYAFVMVAPKYQANGSVLIDTSSRKEETGVDSIIAGLRYIPTLNDYLYEEKFLTEVADDLTQKGFYEEEYIAKLKENDRFPTLLNSLRSSLSTSNTQNSLIVKIYFNSTDGEFAQAAVEAIINRITTISADEYALLSGVIKEASSASGYYSVSNGRTTYVIVGFAVGLIVGLAIAFIKELTNTDIHNSDDVEKIVDAKVLGVIPDFETKKEKKND